MQRGSINYIDRKCPFTELREMYGSAAIWTKTGNYNGSDWELSYDSFKKVEWK
jgi:hypothetical protein